MKHFVEFPGGLIVEILIIFHHGMACRMKSNAACLELALRPNHDLQMDLGVQTAIYHVGVALSVDSLSQFLHNWNR